MPLAVALPVRQELVRRRQEGETLVAAAQTLGVPYRTALRLWQRFMKLGVSRLAADMRAAARQATASLLRWWRPPST